MCLGCIIGEFVPIHKGVVGALKATAWDWSAGMAWEWIKWFALQGRSDEMGTVASLLYKTRNAFYGGSSGVILHALLNGLNKAIYGSALHARQEYHIPQPNVLGKMLSIAGEAAVITASAAGGTVAPAVLSVAQRALMRRRQRAIMNDWQDVAPQVSQMPAVAQMPAIAYYPQMQPIEYHPQFQQPVIQMLPAPQQPQQQYAYPFTTPMLPLPAPPASQQRLLTPERGPAGGRRIHSPREPPPQLRPEQPRLLTPERGPAGGRRIHSPRGPPPHLRPAQDRLLTPERGPPRGRQQLRTPEGLPPSMRSLSGFGKPKAKAKAKAKSEQITIGQPATLPYVDYKNDSFLIKPKTTPPVV